MILLETARLRLRSFVPADVGHLYALDNDPAVMRYINGGAPTPRSVIAREMLPAFLARDDRAPVFGFWAAEARANGRFLGWFCLRRSPDAPGDAILGYRLRRAAWGHGCATEGAEALIRMGFAEPGVQRVVATTYEENRASRRVMAKLGMTLVRRFRLTQADLQEADTFHAAGLELWDGDDVEYALEREMWEQGAGSAEESFSRSSFGNIGVIRQSHPIW